MLFHVFNQKDSLPLLAKKKTLSKISVYLVFWNLKILNVIRTGKIWRCEVHMKLDPDIVHIPFSLEIHLIFAGKKNI